MSLYYSPQIIRTRISPFPGEITVKEGEGVAPDTTILRTSYRLGGVYVVNVAERLKVQPGEIVDYLLKNEGENVKQEEVFAEKSSLAGTKEIRSPIDGIIEKIEGQLGAVIIREKLDRPDIPIIIDIKGEHQDADHENLNLFKKVGDRVNYGETIGGKAVVPMVPYYKNKIEAPCTGTIMKIDDKEGKIWIQKDLPTVETKAFYWGRVKRLIPEYGIDIEFGGYVLECMYGIGEISWGKLVKNNGYEVSGNIIYSDHISTNDVEMIIRSQPAGIITGAANYEVIDIFAEKKIALVVIEGFGELQISSNFRAIIETSMGRNVLLKGATQMRAGVIRPEIIIPSEHEYYDIKQREKDIKIIWGKYYGRIGKIKGPPFQGETSAGIKTWLTTLVLEKNEEITIPCNNAEEM
jgi:hypothetical protein